MTATRRSLISELDDAVRNGSKSDRVDTLRRITDLFLAASARLSEEQISVFDDVIGHLMKRVENRNLAELSERLAPIDNAPNNVIQALARNEAIAIAAPVLTFSARLSSADLIEISKFQGQGHLKAIAFRSDLKPDVTDALLDRGNRDVRRSLAANLTARFSDEGMCLLIRCAQSDDTLPTKLGLRQDVPLHLLSSLLENASESVRRDILALASSSHREEVLNLLEAMGCKPKVGDGDDDQARTDVLRMFEAGELDEISLLQFARAHEYVRMTMALSVMCTVAYGDMEQICRGMRAEDLLIPCRAGGVSWNTYRAIVAATPSGAALAEQRIADLKKDYVRLAPSTAQRILSIRCRQMAAAQHG